MASKAIIFYTDSCLREPLASRVREILSASAGDIPIISVSQQPLDFGKNICVGDIGRSHLSLYRQIVAGLDATDAEIVFMAEHDVLYHPDHFRFEPAISGTFYYNLSCWFANWKPETKEKGLYSGPWGIRHATSQLVCHKEPLKENLQQRIAALEAGWKIRRGIRGACEPGVSEQWAFTRQHDDGINIPRETIKQWKCDTFSTEGKNVDIRHGGNLTGWRRGRGNTWELPPWGRLEDVING
jgi:hypothetical protein